MKKMFEKLIASTFIIILIASVLFPNICGYVEKSSDLSNVYDDELDNIIEGWMEHAHFPGVACCIVKNNTLAWAKPYGYANIGWGSYFKKPMTNDTIFAMASISKSVAAVAVMQLVETGKLKLDENISKFLPFDFKNPKYPTVNISARMLLAHQSSIKNLGFFRSIVYNFAKDHLEWTKNYAKKPSSWFDYAPGENVTYGSIDIDILGYVVENITGKKYAEYCKENIFLPLKMYNTSFFLSDYRLIQLVRQYVWFKTFYVRIPFIKISEAIFPAGGVRSSINDMSHFLIMHTSNGTYDGVRILNESSVQEMHKAQYPETLDEGHYHGLGWYFKNYTGYGKIGGHDGTHLGSYSIMKMRYSNRAGILYFYNQHPYLLSNLDKKPIEEKEAVTGIRKALFDKADEL